MNYPNIQPPCLDCIPQELKALDQWVCWRLEPRPGEDKPTKIPYTPGGGEAKAKAGQPNTWRRYAEAVAAYQNSQEWVSPYSGIGFELADDDGLFGGDLDACIDPNTGEVADWASEIISAANTYTEQSPSGTGLRFFGLGTLPPGRRKAGPREMYDRGRFLTITGRRFGDAPDTVNGCADILPALHAKMFPPKPKAPKTNQNRTAVHLSMSDNDLLAAARSAKNGAKFDALWRGDTSGYGGNDSEADLALVSLLAFYTGDDAGRIANLFSQSELGQREKWNRADYRDRTISAALSGRTEFYSPPGAFIALKGLKAAEVAGTISTAPERGTEDAGTAECAEEVEPSAPASVPGLALTDIGNGQRLAARWGNDLRFCHAWGKWLIWDGQRWQKDDTGEIDRRAKETAQHIYQEAADCPDTAQQTELAKHALRSQSHARVQSMIALANSEPNIPARVQEWDKKPWLLAVNNGTVDLKTGQLIKSRRSDMGTKRAGTHYDPDAAAPKWETFLETVLPDVGLRAFFQRAAGYTLTGDVSAQCLFFLWGSGSNGKSTALRALMDTLGEYALQAAPDLLIARDGGGGPNNDVAELQGTRLVATIEVEDGKRMAEGLVKQITGGDRIKARFMRQDYFEFEPTHKIFLAANHKPTIKGQDIAIWRRIKVIPFEVQIADADKDPHLPEKLRAEMPGILAWAVRGCLDWQKQGLAEPAAVKAATSAYQAEEDVLADFLGECCLLRPSLKVTAAAIYSAYIKWAEQNSERAVSKKNFGTRLQEGRRVFPAVNIGPKYARGWEGIGLIDTESVHTWGEEKDKTDKSGPHFLMNNQLIKPRGDNPDFTSNLSVLSNDKTEDDWEVIV
jgi:putative DNA primase/helicase